MDKIKIVLRDQNCLPTKAHESDAGYDLKSMNDYVVNPNQQVLVDTGINIGLPHSNKNRSYTSDLQRSLYEYQLDWIYQAQIRPRSGLALKKGITITNSPGTIDENYHGNICVIVRNTGKEPFIINKYDKIAQMVINKIPRTQLVIVDSLEQTDRGNNGFGSTGV